MQSINLNNELKFNIGNFIIKASSDNILLKPSFEYKNFITPGLTQVSIKFIRENFPKIKNKNLVFDSGGLWKLYEFDNKFCVELNSTDYKKNPYTTMVFSLKMLFADIYITDEYLGDNDTLSVLEYPLDEILLINLLPQNKGMIVHGCGIKTNKGKGLIFSGKSGAGKSTIAAILNENKKGQILNDDRVIIREVNGKNIVHGTPWSGDFKVCSNDSSELSAIFFINQASKNKLRKLNSLKATSKLIACSFLPFWDKKLIELNLEFCHNLSEAIPVYELEFLPQKSVLKTLKELL